MSRLADILRRHAVAASIAMPAIVGVHAVGVAAGRSVPLQSGDAVAGPYPFLRPLVAFDHGLPVVGTLHIGALLILLFAAAGFLLAAWRITGNRIVAAAATVLFAGHPAAVAATHDAAGVRDVALFVVVAWALALASRPRGRSPRFPNRSPSPSPRKLAAVLLIAPLTAPLGWLAAPLCFVLDVVHGARHGRSRRDVWWPGYVVHGVAALVGVGLSLSLAPSPEVSERLADGSAATLSAGLAGAVTARHAGHLALVLRFAVWGLALAGVAAAVLDVTTGLGRRRTLVPHLAFCGVSLFLAALGPLITPGIGSAGAIASSGVALLFAALFWRVAHLLEPDQDDRSHAEEPTWALVRARVALEPLPPLPEPLSHEAPAPARESTRIERLTGLVESLRRPVAPADPDGDGISAFVRSFTADAGSVLVVSTPGSPWASALASAKAAITFAVAPGPDDVRNDLDGAPGVAVFERDAMPWPVADGGVDALLAVEAFDDLEADALAPHLKELLRVLAPGRHGLVACPPTLSKEVMRALLGEIGFRVDVAADAAPGGRDVFRVRRPRR